MTFIIAPLTVAYLGQWRTNQIEILERLGSFVGSLIRAHVGLMRYLDSPYPRMLK